MKKTNVTQETKATPKTTESKKTIPEGGEAVLWILGALFICLLLFKWSHWVKFVYEVLKGIALAAVAVTFISGVPYYSYSIWQGKHPKDLPFPAPFVNSGEGDLNWTLFLTFWWALFSFLMLGVIIKSYKEAAPKKDNKEDSKHIRGRKLLSFDEAKENALSLIREGEEVIDFGFTGLPERVSNTHFSVTGTTGSGKTILIRRLMQSVLPGIEGGSGKRALIYDAKADMVSILSGMGLKVPLKILNPFDSRSVAWDMAKDITAPATAQQAAELLIPQIKGESQPFFPEAARHLLRGVFVSFINTVPENWTFRDVLLALKNKESLKEVLLKTSYTKDLVEQYLNEERTAQNILSTLATKLQRYEYIAAIWERAGEKISSRDFLSNEWVLVLGNDEATRSALDAINQVIFRRLSELILSETESETRRTWIFLDEVREAGKLEGLSRLLTKGRSKGACLVLGFQDIEGLKDVYGPEVAGEILGQCSNKAILQLSSPETARWASSLFGEREVLEYRINTNETEGRGETDAKLGSVGGSTSTSNSKSTSSQEQLVKREVILPGEFMHIHPPSAESGFEGYYLIPVIGGYKVKAPFNEVIESLSRPSLEVSAFQRRPEAHQYLEPWSEKDLERLKMTVKVPEAAVEPIAQEGSLEGIGHSREENEI